MPNLFGKESISHLAHKGKECHIVHIKEKNIASHKTSEISELFLFIAKIGIVYFRFCDKRRANIQYIFVVLRESISE